MYKINNLEWYIEQDIYPIFYNNFKWSIIYKNIYYAVHLKLIFCKSTIFQLRKNSREYSNFTHLQCFFFFTISLNHNPN